MPFNHCICSPKGTFLHKKNYIFPLINHKRLSRVTHLKLKFNIMPLKLDIYLSTAGRRTFSLSSISRMSLPHSSSKSLGWRPGGSFTRPNSIHTLWHIHTKVSKHSNGQDDDTWRGNRGLSRNHHLLALTMSCIVSLRKGRGGEDEPLNSTNALYY